MNSDSQEPVFAFLADRATRASRVGARRGDASDADAAVVDAQEQYDIGPLDWARLDASGAPAQTLERARAALRPGGP